jgi:hypothetical protein
MSAKQTAALSIDWAREQVRLDYEHWLNYMLSQEEPAQQEVWGVV